ncbi:hypothetical protein C8R46DRAFT_884092 [Mycena filopes]|nr:hypothetical protein C8R46DRAFT_884092 [Mycena filopes]
MASHLYCEHCTAQITTQQGLRSHLSQSRACRDKHNTQYADTSDSDADNESDSSIGGTGTAPVGDTEDVVMGPFDPDPGADSDTGAGENFGADPPEDDVVVPPVEERASAKRRRATMEEVEDEDERWVQDFPQDMAAGAILEECKTQFEELLEKQKAAGEEPWSPFKSEDEWELARWLMTSSLSQSKTDDFLKLNSVRKDMSPSFHNNRSFLKHIDALPNGPEWNCMPFDLKGDELDADNVPKVETVYMWYRNPVECVKELLSNPAFKKMGFAPRRVFKDVDEDGNGRNREYSEMWTAEWWWEIQSLLPKGSTLCPIIISSDKTQLTRFSGDQQAWPVVGEKGVRMDCADGFVRMMFPILSAYIADYPEQCLIVGCRENSCPRCLVDPKHRGDSADSPWRNPADTLRFLSQQSRGEHPPEFQTQNLRPINPFWADLPHCDIFSCITPDILHELHNGFFGSHLVTWTSEAMTGAGPEIDLRFRAMTPHPSLRHFKKGISLTTQWTGAEHKNMEKVFVGILPDTTDPGVQRAVKGVVDFIHYAHFETHCDESLAQMDAAWASFHANKQIFIDLEIRSDFDIIKLHKLKHYTNSIRSRGTADGFNTENTERLHIDLAKVAYKASNRRDYTSQMTVWLRRQEAVHKFGTYLQWAAPGYVARPAGIDEETPTVAPPEPPPPVAEDLDDEGDLEEPQPTITSSTTYAVAKNAGFPDITAASIAADFHAPDFLFNLSEFLHSHSIIPPIEPSETSPFQVYKKLSLNLPAIAGVGTKTVKDTITALKAQVMKITPSGVRPPKPPHFDTVLVRTHARGENASPIDGLRVARVKVIFRLPDSSGSFPHPLAYIEWFRPLTHLVPDIEMYQIAPSTRNYRANSTIIPVTDILRSCHLIPAFGRSIDPTWSSDQVLDQSKSFYLNPYLRHHDFYLFRYLMDLYTSRKEAEERRVRIRQLGRAGRH